MIREKLIDKKVGQGKFRWRSHEVSRIEGLSDAVFGFAITLLLGITVMFAGFLISTATPPAAAREDDRTVKQLFPQKTA